MADFHSIRNLRDSVPVFSVPGPTGQQSKYILQVPDRFGALKKWSYMKTSTVYCEFRAVPPSRLFSFKHTDMKYHRDNSQTAAANDTLNRMTGHVHDTFGWERRTTYWRETRPFVSRFKVLKIPVGDGDQLNLIQMNTVRTKMLQLRTGGSWHSRREHMEINRSVQNPAESKSRFIKACL